MDIVRDVMSNLQKDKVGQLIGFAMASHVEGDARGVGMVGNIINELTALMTQPHFPNLEHVLADMLHPNVKGKIVRPAISGAILGYILSEIDIHPQLTSMGKALASIAPNIVIGVGYQSLLEHASLSYSEYKLPSFSRGNGGTTERNPMSRL